MSVAATHHSLFMSSNGLLFGCGLNNHGQVGSIPLISSSSSSSNKLDAISILVPRPIVCNAPAVCGRIQSKERNCGGTTDVKSNYIPKVDESSTATRSDNDIIDSEVILVVTDCIDKLVLQEQSCMDNDIAPIDNSATSLASSRGQPTLLPQPACEEQKEEEQTEKLYCRVPILRSIGCGEFHSAAVTVDGRLIAWGNCPRLHVAASVLSPHNSNANITTSTTASGYFYRWMNAPPHHEFIDPKKIDVTALVSEEKQSVVIDQMTCSGSGILFQFN